jgi:hypothetical protein
VISGLSHVVANIDGHWRITWSLISEPVGISRDARKLTGHPHINNDNNKKKNCN